MADNETRQKTGERPPESVPGAPPPRGPAGAPGPGSGPGGAGQESEANGPGIRLGRPFGVPLFVSPSWFLIAAFITFSLAPSDETLGAQVGGWRYLVSFGFAVFLYASVVLHELAHAAVAKRFGLPVRRIVIHFLGGVSEIEREAETPGREFWVAVVGPLTSGALAGIGATLYYLVFPHPGTSLSERVVAALLAGFWGSNLLVAVFNMLPGLPLDGGRVLRAIVWGITGKAWNGTVAAAWTGRALAVVVFVVMTYAYSGGGVVNPLGVAIAGFMAMFIWFGAGQALVVGRLKMRIPLLEASLLTRRAITVEARTPLAEGLRRAHEANVRGMIVVDSAGRPTGVVNEAAVIATPEQRRPWVDVGSVSRPLEPGMVIGAELTGEALLEALRTHPATEYMVVDAGGDIAGVLAAVDVQAAFLGRPLPGVQGAGPGM